MRIPLRALIPSLVFLSAVAAAAQTATDPLHEQFLNPPADARPMMRWWWFGPAVTKPELRKELETMRDAGIGGVEIQPVYPIALDNPGQGIRNLRYLSPEFLDAVSFANHTARSLGLRVDITLGSGWPYGGPKTTLDLAAGKLRVERMPIKNNVAAEADLQPGERIIAAFAVTPPSASGDEPGAGNHTNGNNDFDAASAQRIDLATRRVAGDNANRVALYFIASHTGQQVKRAAFGAEGNVLDHFRRPAIDEHLRDVATPLLAAFGDQPPASVFSDSLEVYGSDWTADLPAEFERRRGYDLIPHLPELVAGGTREAEAVRHDWGQTLDELIRENYLAPISEFADQHNTLFRSQTYGDPAVTLADQAVPQLIEGEGMQWRQFSYTRWATSAAHLYGRNVVSAETWTWLHSPAFRATPLDMKAEADRMFLLGVNQFVGHGWPYSPPSAGEPGWAFYAAAVFNQHNPWLPVMPDITQYLQRVSWLLRQGKPANDVAILLPEDDAQAAFTPGQVSITDEMRRRITPELMSAVLDAGYNVDFIDGATIDKLGTIPYPVLLIPPTDRLPLGTYKRIAEYAKTGKVIAIGRAPSLTPGLMELNQSAEIAAISSKLFRDAHDHATLLADDSELATTLHKMLPPDLDATGPAAGLGFIHRKLPDRDIYFLTNTENRAVESSLRFRSAHQVIEVWDSGTGRILSRTRTTGPERIPLHLEPYESRIFVLSDRPTNSPLPSSPENPGNQVADLSRNWTISFAGSHRSTSHLNSLISWTDIAGRQFYSGEAIYTREFDLNQNATTGNRLVLDFGPGTPVADDRPAGADGMHALLDPPIREAAIVYVNGRRAGSLWHPPYRLDITEFIHAGQNRLEIHVFNTAINQLAGQPRHDYTALRAKYGTRFEPQDQDRIHPVASGMLGPVHIMTQSIQ